MKKIKSLTFTLILLFFSFNYTNNVLTYLKDKDPIMIQIKKNTQIIRNPINATIKDHTIIPGLSGLKIDQNKSYQKMKKINKYQENLLIFTKIKPNISLKNNQNKLIINGNYSQNNISIIVKINDLKIFNKLKQKNYFEKLNLILTDKILQENKSLKNNIIVIEDNINLNQNIDFCYSTSINFKNICQTYNKYTIYPIFINCNYYYNTYRIIKNGSIIAYNIINENNINELDIIIKKLSLDYNILLLNSLLEE